MAKEKEDDYKFGVEDLADKLGIEPASARIKLRNAGVKKAPTGRYGWKTKKEVEELAEELKSAPAKEKSKDKSSKKDDDEKSSKKSSGKKSAGKKK